jgi:phage-related protein (TIGR01555 family)
MRADGYENTLSGLTGGRANANVFVAPPKLSEGQLKSLYDGNWLARRIVDALPTQALRKPLVADQEKLAPFHKVNNDNRYPGGVARHGLSMGRLCGGAVIVLGVVNSGAALEAPLPVDKDGNPTNAGDVAFLEVLTRFDLDSASRYDTPDDPTKHKRTEIWKVTKGRLKDLKIHESRMIFCEGLAKANLTDDQEDLDWPWLSVIQPINEILGNYGISWTAVSHLIQEASIGWLKLKGLTEMLTSEDKKEVDARMTLMSTGRNVSKTVFLEAGDDAGNGEEYGRTDVSFAGLPDLMREITLVVTGAAGIPYQVLLGDTPSGLNATGDSTMRQWYDDVEAYRGTVKPKIDRIFAATKVAIEWEWPSLWSPTAAEAAELRLKNFQADQLLFTMGVVEPEHILESRGKDGSLGLPGLDVDKLLADLKRKKEAERLAATSTIEGAPNGEASEGQDPQDSGPNAASGAAGGSGGDLPPSGQPRGGSDPS